MSKIDKISLAMLGAAAFLGCVVLELSSRPSSDPVTDWQNASVAADERLADHLNTDSEHPQCGHVANPMDGNTTQLLCEQ